jgi:hypothetical protein
MATGISAVPDGTRSVLVGFPQDCVLGYFQPVPSGLTQTFSAACVARTYPKSDFLRSLLGPLRDVDHKRDGTTDITIVFAQP